MEILSLSEILGGLVLLLLLYGGRSDDDVGSSTCASTSCLGGLGCDAARFRRYGITCFELEPGPVFDEAGTGCNCRNCTCLPTIEEEPIAYSNLTLNLDARDDDELADAVEETVLSETNTSAASTVVVSLVGDIIALRREVVVPPGRTARLRGRGTTLVGSGPHRLLSARPNATLELYDLKLSNGTASAADVGGGCVFIGADAALVAHNVTFESCGASTFGGALALWAGSVASLTRTTILKSYAGFKGGGIYSWRASLYLGDQSLIEDCAVIGGVAASSGGGLYSSASPVAVTLDSTILRRNSCGNTGGCAAVTGAHSISMRNIHFASCETYKEDSIGGALRIVFAETLVSLERVTITNSSARRTAGGLVVTIAGSVAANHLRFERCRAGALAGAFVIAGAPGYLNDVLVLDSVAAFDREATPLLGGGGGFLLWGATQISNARFEGCSSGKWGGGLLLKESSQGTTLTNVSFHNCSAKEGGGLALADGASFVKTLGSLRAENCFATEDGGFLYASALRHRIELLSLTIVQACSAGAFGGGVAMRGGDTRVYIAGAAYFSNNEAREGGAIFASGSARLALSSSSHRALTFLENSADTLGGAVALRGSNTRLVASGATCEYVDLIFDWADAGAGRDGVAALLSPSLVVGESAASSFDARGVYMLASPSDKAALQPETLEFCVPEAFGNVEAWGFDRRGLGWLGGDVRIETPRLTQTCQVEDAEHAALFFNFSLVSSQEEASDEEASPKEEEESLVVFRGNRAANGGAVALSQASGAGGLLAPGPRASFTFVRFESNVAIEFGGAVYVDALSTFDLYNGTVTENAAETGGAIAAWQLADVSVNKTTFSKNLANRYGGGLYVNGAARSAIDTCVLDSNVARESGGALAWVDCTKGDHVLKESQALNNVADGNGGGIFSFLSTINVDVSLFDQNQARGNGAGIYVAGDSVSTLAFDYSNRDEGPCVAAHVVTDWRQTDAKCTTRLFYDANTPSTCDSQLGDCSEHRVFLNDPDVCDGCVCEIASENYYTLSLVNGTSEEFEEVGRGTPTANGVAADAYCLIPGATYAVRATDQRGHAWFGGTLAVVADGGMVFFAGDLEWKGDGKSTEDVLFEVPLVDRAATSLTRNVAEGGGGALFYPAGRRPNGADHIHLAPSNQAAFGPAEATPPALLVADPQTLVCVAGLPCPSLVLTVLDDLGQKVASDNFFFRVRARVARRRDFASLGDDNDDSDDSDDSDDAQATVPVMFTAVQVSGGEAACLSGECRFDALMLFFDAQLALKVGPALGKFLQGKGVSDTDVDNDDDSAAFEVRLNLTLYFERVGVVDDDNSLGSPILPVVQTDLIVRTPEDDTNRPPETRRRPLLGPVARAVAAVTVVCNLLVASICFVWLRLYADRLIVQISQPACLSACVLGAATATWANAVDALPGDLTSTRCKASVFLYGLGAVLTTAALYSAMATMERVVEAALAFRRVSRRDFCGARSFKVAVTMCVVETLILLAWNCDRPLRARTRCAGDRYDGDGPYDGTCLETMTTCASPSAGIYVPLLAAWHLICYAAVIFMCYWCRNLPSVALERHSIFAAAFSQMQLNIVAGLVLFTLRDAPAAFAVVKLLVNWLGNLATLILLFAGKMNLVYAYGDFDYALVVGYIQKSLADSTQRDHVYEMLAVRPTAATTKTTGLTKNRGGPAERRSRVVKGASGAVASSSAASSSRRRRRRRGCFDTKRDKEEEEEPAAFAVEMAWGGRATRDDEDEDEDNERGLDDSKRSDAEETEADSGGGDDDDDDDELGRGTMRGRVVEPWPRPVPYAASAAEEAKTTTPPKGSAAAPRRRP